ncbi:MAG: hypothetical protein K2Y28_06040 [Burkholderiaceae bacterium]|nr:hypothetical protein [Burkholderiaceae bacterium]
MQLRPATSLHFKSKAALPTIEVDFGSLDGQQVSIESILQEAVNKYVGKHPAERATFYIHFMQSVSFGELTNSALIGVAGSADILKVLRTEFASTKDVRSRYGDMISQSECQRKWHVEDGLFWEIADQLNWICTSAADNQYLEDHPEFQDPMLEDDPAFDAKAFDRLDDGLDLLGINELWTISSTLKQLRDLVGSTFHIPLQAIQFVGPDGNPVRGNTQLKTFIGMWEPDQSI